MRTVVILSPHFPPATLAGVHRARHLAKHLPEFGWHPIVVRADERHYTEALDPELAALVPSYVEQVRTSAVPAGLARIFGIGDIGVRGFFGYRSAVDALVKTQRVDAVLITGSPFYPMLLAQHVRERLGIPVILDFQDPWISAEGARRPRWTKGWAAHRLAVMLEPQAVRHADFITSVSERQNDEMLMRYPLLDRSRTAAIPIGGDPDDYESLRKNDTLNTQVGVAGTAIEPELCIRYVGTLWPAAISTLRVFLESIGELRQRRPDLYGRLKLSFIGTTRNPESPDGCWVSGDASQLGISRVIETRQERVPYLEAIKVQAQSDVILLLGSTEAHYTASKIYGVLMSGRPYLSIFHRLSSSHEILNSAGGGIAISFDSEAELSKLRSEIVSALEKLLDGIGEIGRPDPEAYAPYTAHSIAGQFADVLEKVTL